VGEEGKDGAYGKAMKGAPTEGTGMLCKRKGAGKRKKVEKSRGRRSSICGQAMRSTAKVEEKLSRRVKKESRGALWKRCPRRGAIMGSRIVYERSSSFVPSLREVQKPEVLCGRQ